MHTPDSTEPRKAVALTALAENFGKDLSEPLMDLWLNLLAEYSASQVQEAVRRVIETYEFKTLPPFGVLKRHLEDVTGVSEKALELMAAAEWSVLWDSVSRVGRYQQPTLHETTWFVVRAMGGWGSVCSWPESELAFKHREFLRLWKEAHGREEMLALGADCVTAAMVAGQDRHTGPQRIGNSLHALFPKRLTQ